MCTHQESKSSFSLWWRSPEPRSYLCSLLALCGLSPGMTLKPLKTAVASPHELSNASKRTKTQAKRGKLDCWPLRAEKMMDTAYRVELEMCVLELSLCYESCVTLQIVHSLPLIPLLILIEVCLPIHHFSSPIPLPAQLPPWLVGELQEHSDHPAPGNQSFEQQGCTPVS